MKVISYVFYTWFIASPLHPVCWMIASVLEDGIMELQWVFFIFFYSLFFSIPAFALAWASLHLILLFNYNWYEKFFLWHVFSVSSIILCICFLSFVFSQSYPSIDELSLFIPGMIATIISITVRYKSFIKLIASRHKI